MRTGIVMAVAGGLVGWMAAVRAAERPVTPQQAEFFEKQVRPVLVESCLSCHGPEKQKAGLRLDSRQLLLKGAESGPVVKPGDPENSPLVQAIRYEGDIKMPPKGKLKAPAIDALTAWVKMGAPWPETAYLGTGGAIAEAAKRHWAFQPIKNPAPPETNAHRWPRTTIDRFILAKLEAKGLKPSPAANRRTLIRRVTFDLIGLPPTADEISAFEADHSPDAFAKVIDRLLASPHYGERWGRYWLDVTRYADTKGYVFFEEPNYPWAYTYRDYVIRALNEDLPYDQFILQQLAADQLLLDLEERRVAGVESAKPRSRGIDDSAPATRDRRSLTALGFLTLGGRFMNNTQDILDDRIDVLTRGLLGLTVSCARCHDHKFDPIPSRDYYSLYGVLASCTEPTVPPLFEAPPQTEAYRKFEQELQARERKLTEFVRAKHDELVRSAKERAAEYMLAALQASNKPTTAEFMLLSDTGDLNPKMVLRWQLYLERAKQRRDPVFTAWHALAVLPEKEFAQQARELSARLISQPDPARPVNPIVAKTFANRPPLTLAEAAQRYSELLNHAEKLWQETLKKADAETRRHSDAESARVTASPRPRVPVSLPDPAQEELRQVFHGPESPPLVKMLVYGDLDLLPDRASQAKLQELRKALESWRATGPGAPARANVLQDLPTPIEPRVFLRGSPSNLGEQVPRQFVAVLAGDNRKPFEHGSGRLELAQAIVDRQNPLTARVIVNRIWLHYFGFGLVRTPSDFGLRSDPPSHPELLDHLATIFMGEPGVSAPGTAWSIKKLHRLILLSAVYQQQSDDRPECQRIDPENTLLWKMNRQRLDFEATRDSLLAVSGRLDQTIGGPSVPSLTSPAANRRTLYGFLDRLNVPGLYRTFDFPMPDSTSPQRATTTVAPQALFLMNHPFVTDCVRRLLQRPEIVAEQDAAKRVERIYRLLYGRAPTAEELLLARDYLGDGSTPAWERYTQALLLANEFLFVD